MSLTLHIDPFSSSTGDAGVTAPDVSPELSSELSSENNRVNFITRIWLWLSQMWGEESFGAAAEAVFYLGAKDALNMAAPYRPNRHALRMIARRARGIMPASRYARRDMAGPLRGGASLAELKAWARLNPRIGRFQAAHRLYYIKALLCRLAQRRAACMGAARGLCTYCSAPLSPD